MVMPRHPCFVPSCSVLVPLDRLACKRHWYLIPFPLRSRVWNAWRRRLAYASPENVAAHEAAREAALAALPDLRA